MPKTSSEIPRGEHHRHPWGRGTPWGAVQSAYQWADGLYILSTASHGGLWLSPDRVSELRSLFPEFTPCAGWPWLEEDCDLSLAMLAWPDLFLPVEIREAVFSIKSMVAWHGCGAKWASVRDRIPAAVLEIADEEERRLIASDAWQFAGLCSGHFREPWRDGWAVSWRRVRDAQTATKLMPYPSRQHLTGAELDQFPTYVPALHDMTREEIAARARGKAVSA